MLAKLGLALAWLFAFRATIGYAQALFFAETYRANLVVLLAALALVAMRSRKLPLDRPLVFRTAPLLLIAAALVSNVILVRLLDVRTLAIAAFGAGTYGLLGLFLPPAAWKRGLAGAMLVVLALPFGDQASTYLGFAARLMTARIVEAALSALGVSAVSESSVLALESGVAYVDVPCSGIKSLWTGAIFFFGATYFERVRLDLRWVMSAIAFFCAVLAANVLRVLGIVILASVLALPKAAEILHEPLGVIGFGAACVFGALLLKLTGRKDSCTEDQEPARPLNAAPLAAAMIASGLFAIHVEPATRPAIDVSLELPFAIETIALTEPEAGLLERVGESAMRKIHFDNGALSGTALVLATERWRAHHPPEICLASAGAKIGPLRELTLGEHRRARLISIDGGARTALYFYASGGETTGDIVERIYADVFTGDRRWVMVSILIDRPVDAEDPALLELYEQFRRGVKS